MTANPFTAFPFAASGANQVNRTLPDRLQDIHNVKDFGAVGDWNGTSGTDNWAAIMACFNWNTISHTVNSTTNKTASFTGAISSVYQFQGSISGSTLTAAAYVDPTYGTLTLGAIAVASYTYNPTTGEVDLTMSASVGFVASTPFTVQGLNIGGLNINNAISTFVSGTSVKFIGPTGLAGLASGGGSIILGGLTASQSPTSIGGGILAAGQTIHVNGSNSFTINSYTYNPSNGHVVLTLDGSTPASFTNGDTINVAGLTAQISISSYTYNSTTGAVALTMASAVPFSSGSITVSGLNITGLNNTWVVSSVTGGGLTVNFIGTQSLGGSPSAGGTCTFALPAVNGSFTSTSVSSSSVAYTGATGNNGAATGGGSFTVSFSGTVVIASQATGPTGGAGTYNLVSSFGDSFTQPILMGTNCILVAASSGFTGTINVTDSALNNSGTDASPNQIRQDTFFQTKVTSQQSGTTGASGTYILGFFQNWLSQAMMTASDTIVLNTTFPNNVPSVGYIRNLNNASCGQPTQPQLPAIRFFNAISTLQITYINGLYSANDVLDFVITTKGIIYFPPGNYYVSQPILSQYSILDNTTVVWRGDWGGTTVTGAFPDYVFKRLAGFANFISFEKFNIVNTDPNGGGIRNGGGSKSIIRDITVTANRGISNYDSDDQASIQAGESALDQSIQNCSVTAGVNYANSIGFMIETNGAIINCRASGCAIGLECGSGEGAVNLFGFYAENCGTAIKPGALPGGATFVTGVNAQGIHLKNNSVGIDWVASSSGNFCGVFIEGTNGQAPGSTNPQYGILDADGSGGSGSDFGDGELYGIVVTGQYDQYGISLNGQDDDPHVLIAGTASINSTDTTKSWRFMNVGGSVAFPVFVACNSRHIYTVATAPTGAREGDFRDVSDCNTSTWGATAGGGGSTHALLRNNGTNNTVMGI